MDAPSEQEKHFTAWNGGPTQPEGYFLSPFVQRREMAKPVLMKGFLQLSPEAAMWFAPFMCTHPPPLVLPFLLVQNLSPMQWHYWKWHHQVSSCMMHICVYHIYFETIQNLCMLHRHGTLLVQINSLHNVIHNY